jgi:hypothetical protein
MINAWHIIRCQQSGSAFGHQLFDQNRRDMGASCTPEFERMIQYHFILIRLNLSCHTFSHVIVLFQCLVPGKIVKALRILGSSRRLSGFQVSDILPRPTDLTSSEMSQGNQRITPRTGWSRTWRYTWSACWLGIGQFVSLCCRSLLSHLPC